MQIHFFHIFCMQIDNLVSPIMSLKGNIGLKWVNIRHITSAIRQKSESQNGCFKKTKHARFSEKRTYTYQGVRSVRFSENLACFVFLKHHILWAFIFSYSDTAPKLDILLITYFASYKKRPSIT